MVEQEVMPFLIRTVLPARVVVTRIQPSGVHLYLTNHRHCKNNIWYTFFSLLYTLSIFEYKVLNEVPEACVVHFVHSRKAVLLIRLF